MRYRAAGLERLVFIKHARELGFSIASISSLIELREHPDRSCREATEIAHKQLSSMQEKLRKLKALEGKLKCVADGCQGKGVTKDCYVLASLGDHQSVSHSALVDQMQASIGGQDHNPRRINLGHLVERVQLRHPTGCDIATAKQISFLHL